RGIVEHYRLQGERAEVRATIRRLVRAGALVEHEVEDDGPAVYSTGEIGAGRAPSGAVLLSPFDNLLWDRPFARRVLAFDHVIEVYKPQPQRRYGYYVLPLVWRDRIVCRADLKSDRSAGTLIVKSFHTETAVRGPGPLDVAI